MHRLKLKEKEKLQRLRPKETGIEIKRMHSKLKRQQEKLNTRKHSKGKIKLKLRKSKLKDFDSRPLKQEDNIIEQERPEEEQMLRIRSSLPSKHTPEKLK